MLQRSTKEHKMLLYYLLKGTSSLSWDWTMVLAGGLKHTKDGSTMKPPERHRAAAMATTPERS